jgi:hypothetical protein
MKHQLFNRMLQYQIIDGSYEPDTFEIKEQERPPISDIPEYRQKFKKGNNTGKKATKKKN